jgi:hypothetical protein
MKRPERLYAIQSKLPNEWCWMTIYSSIDANRERVFDELDRDRINYPHLDHRMVTMIGEWKQVQSADGRRTAWLKVSKKVNKRVRRL